MGATYIHTSDACHVPQSDVAVEGTCTAEHILITAQREMAHTGGTCRVVTRGVGRTREPREGEDGGGGAREGEDGGGGAMLTFILVTLPTFHKRRSLLKALATWNIV